MESTLKVVEQQGFDITQHQGIILDIGCGESKMDLESSRVVGMDKRNLPGVDLVHDIEVFPWPLPDACCLTVISSHVLEHIKPWLTIDLFNEVWRIMRPGGQWAISLPYAGSFGFWQDPTHCNGFNEATFQYFDPDYPLWQIYKPSPWKIQKGFPVWQNTGNMEVIMNKRMIAESSKEEANDVTKRDTTEPDH